MTDFTPLSARLTGTLLTPDAPGFGGSIQPFNITISHHPAAIVAAASEADVIETIRFANDADLPVRINVTGHGAHFAYDDGIVLDLSALSSVAIDADARTAVIGGGTRWATVIDAAAALGLAPITGSSTNVGVVGYLLGGGIGPLARAYGFSSDRVLSARVVTGTGEVVVASADENPELFWAIRGGKGGLGVVTEVTVSLVEVPALYAGSLFFDIADATAVLPAWIEWTHGAPDEVTTSLMLIRFPDFEQVPPPLRGRHLVNLRFAVAADDARGAALAAPLRALAPVYLDLLGPLPLTDVGRINNDPAEPGPSYLRGVMLADADDRFAETLLSLIGADSTLPIMGAELRHLGGALSAPADSAVGYRDFLYSLNVFGVPDPSLFATVLPGVFAQVFGALAPWTSPHSNANFIADTRDPGEFASVWPPATLERLAEVRATLDPDGALPFGPPRESTHSR